MNDTYTTRSEFSEARLTMKTGPDNAGSIPAASIPQSASKPAS